MCIFSFSTRSCCSFPCSALGRCCAPSGIASTGRRRRSFCSFLRASSSAMRRRIPFTATCRRCAPRPSTIPRSSPSSSLWRGSRFYSGCSSSVMRRLRSSLWAVRSSVISIPPSFCSCSRAATICPTIRRSAFCSSSSSARLQIVLLTSSGGCSGGGCPKSSRRR